MTLMLPVAISFIHLQLLTINYFHSRSHRHFELNLSSLAIVPVWEQIHGITLQHCSEANLHTFLPAPAAAAQGYGVHHLVALLLQPVCGSTELGEHLAHRQTTNSTSNIYSHNSKLLTLKS